MPIVINPRQELAVKRECKLIFGRNDKAACADELPTSDLIGDDLVELLVAEIIELDVRLACGGEPAGRQHRQAGEDFAPRELAREIRWELAHA